MKITLLCAVLAATLCAQLANVALAQSMSTQQTATQAKRLVKQGSYSQAIAQLKTVLENSATDIDRAELLLVLAEATERIAATQKEKTVESMSKARLAAVALDDQVVALPGATSAQKIQALKHATLHLKLEGRREDANQRRKTLLSMTELPAKQRADLLLELAGQTKDQTEAVGYLEQAGALPGLNAVDRAFILLKTGQTFVETGQLSAASKSFQTIDGMADLPPSWKTSAGLGLTEVDLAEGRVEPASLRIRALVSDHAKSEVPQHTVLTLGKKFRDAKSPGTFIFLMEYLSQNPSDSGNQTENALLALADYYILQKQNDKAHRALEKLPFSQRAVVKDLDLYHKQGQSEQLVKRLGQLVSLAQEERSAKPSESLKSLWQQLNGLTGSYIRAYSQPQTKQAAVSLLNLALAFYPSDTAEGQAILKEISRVEGL